VHDNLRHLAAQARRKVHLSEDDARQLTERYSNGQLGRYLINNIKSPDDMSSRIGLIQGNLRKWGRDRNYPEGYGLAH
jgi:hypothetical protein